MAIKEEILIKINGLKKSLSWSCVFCKYNFNKEQMGRELLTLPICGLCLDRYNMSKNEAITPKQKLFLNNGFANVCYFCEKEKDNLKITRNGFKLCQSSCYQRYEMINSGLGKNSKEDGAEINGKPPVMNNSYASYGEALKALNNAKGTGQSFVVNEMLKRNKK